MCKNNIFSYISYILTIVICIILVCFILGKFEYVPITILTNSMEPQFSRGDVVIYKKLNEEEIKEIEKDSIIVYSSCNLNVVHRVVDIKEEDGIVFYQTKGDSNNVPDMEWVKANQIKGLYVFRIKYIGFPSVWFYDYYKKGK